MGPVVRPWRTRRVALAALFAGIVAIAAACGGSEETTDSEATPVTTVASTSTAAPAPTTTTPQSAPAPDLAGTQWTVVRYALPDGAMTNLWPGSEITLAFADDGTVSGTGGCNDFAATYAVEGPYDEFNDGVRDPGDGQAISIASIVVGDEVCDDPTFVMEQEAEFIDALAATGRWVIVRGDLSLRTPDGLFLATAEPVS
ncbi:MAG: META domain-containing protein [Actinomycetota bacterium]